MTKIEVVYDVLVAKGNSLLEKYKYLAASDPEAGMILSAVKVPSGAVATFVVTVTEYFSQWVVLSKSSDDSAT